MLCGQRKLWYTYPRLPKYCGHIVDLIINRFLKDVDEITDCN